MGMAAWLAHRNVPDRIRERNASATEPYRKTTTALSVEPTHDMLRGAQYTRRHCRLNAEDHDGGGQWRAFRSSERSTFGNCGRQHKQRDLQRWTFYVLRPK